MDAAFAEDDRLPDGTLDMRREVWAVLAALLSGAKYGIKIRLPHALVMTFMFRRDLSTYGKLRVIAMAVWEHARRLGSFALIYKSCLLALKVLHRRSLSMTENAAATNSLGRLIVKILGTNNKTSPENGIVSHLLPGRPAQKFHALIAGAVGGCFVWGEWSAISHQVLLYVSIRVLAGLWKLLPIHKDEHWRNTHRLASTVAWAAVMYLWETWPHVLQRSMRNSMDEIYDSGIFGLRTQRM